MAAHNDPLTDLPPPSRFDPEDLDLVGDDLLTDTPHPLPFVAWKNDDAAVLRPKLLLLCFSRPSCTLLHHIPAKKLAASIILPGIPMGGNAIAAPSPEDHSCCLYALDGDSIVVALVQYSIPAESYHGWARVFFSAVEPEEILCLDAIKPENFRSGRAADDSMLFLLETDAMREKGMDRGGVDIPFLPSGSLIDGAAAAVMSYCQMKGLAGRMVVAWPESEMPVLGKNLPRLLGDLPGAGALDFDRVVRDLSGKRGVVSSSQLFM